MTKEAIIHCSYYERKKPSWVIVVTALWQNLDLITCGKRACQLTAQRLVCRITKTTVLGVSVCCGFYFLPSTSGPP